VDIIFGIHPVLECLRARSRPVERLIVAQGASSRAIQEIIDLGRRFGIPVRFQSRNLLDQKSAGGVHQGVLAVCGMRPAVEIADLLRDLSPLPLLVALDSIEDPRNAGAILRTCAACGVEGVLLPKNHSVGLSATVAKTAAGALDLLRIARVTNLVSSLKQLKEKGIWLAGVETGQAQSYYELDFNVPLALVFGNEDVGLRRLVRETCDYLISIPTPGPIHSLNVSVAAGIVLFEVVRQRTEVMAKP
jgi:23S rRNA (guanosine2251-2'-O)-methyltransferase